VVPKKPYAITPRRVCREFMDQEEERMGGNREEDIFQGRRMGESGSERDRNGRHSFNINANWRSKMKNT
jgi:hypothetical protein